MTDNHPLDGFEFSLKRATFKELKAVKAKHGRGLIEIAAEMLEDYSALDTLMEAVAYLLRKQAQRAGIKLSADQVEDFLTLEYIESTMMPRGQDDDPLAQSVSPSLTGLSENATNTI